MVKWITEKTASDIRFYWKRIQDQTFDQETLASLIVAAREYVPKGSPTREIGDFIAHPRRDRGILLKHFESYKIVIDGKETTEIHLKTGITPKIEFSFPPPLKPTCFTDDLKASLVSIELDDPVSIGEVIDRNFQELLLCFCGLLHFTVLRINKKSDVILKVCRIIEAHVPEPTLTLRGFRGPTMMFLMDTRLPCNEWCEVDPLNLVNLSEVRAMRSANGVKLRI